MRPINSELERLTVHSLTLHVALHTVYEWTNKFDGITKVKIWVGGSGRDCHGYRSYCEFSSFVITDISYFRRCRETALRNYFERPVSEAAVPQRWAVQAFLALSPTSAQPTASGSVRQTARTLLSVSVVLSGAAASSSAAGRSLPTGVRRSVVFQTRTLPSWVGETGTWTLSPASQAGTWALSPARQAGALQAVGYVNPPSDLPDPDVVRRQTLVAHPHFGHLRARPGRPVERVGRLPVDSGASWKRRGGRRDRGQDSRAPLQR